MAQQVEPGQATDEYAFPPTPEILACPYPAYARLRAERPVFQAPGSEFIVARHEDVMSVFRRTGTDFSSPSRTKHEIRNILEIPEDEHKPRRVLMSRCVAPGRLKAYEPTIYGFAEEIVDRFASRGEVEFVTEFAFPFPCYVVPGLLG